MKYAFYITLLAFSFLYSGCKTEPEFDGPSLNDLYGEFSILQPFSAQLEQVDFSNGQTEFFNATFSKNVDWTITIRGLQSGAVKEISGFSNQINAANSTWNGSITNLPMFKPEICAIELRFAAESDTLRDTISITGTKTNEGLLLSDFENGLNPDWITFAQSGANMTFQVQTADSAAQGQKYFDIGGIVNWDYLIGYLDAPASAYGSPTFSLSPNASEVYFNTMLYKPRELNNGIMLFQFREDDNGDGVFTPASEDMYAIEVPMNKNGWSLLSAKYSDLQSLINGQPSTPAGNGLREPNKLWKVSVLFLANPATGYAHAFLDYMIFTQGAALEP